MTRGATAFSRSVGEHLRGVMTTKGVTQGALAERIERSTGYVSEHLNGSRPPDMDMVYAVAELANVDVQWLLEELARRMRSDAGASDVSATADRIASSARAKAREKGAGQRKNATPDTA